MTYNVFSGTLNPTQSIWHHSKVEIASAESSQSHFSSSMLPGGVAAQRVGRRTCDQEVASSTPPVRARLHNDTGQIVHILAFILLSSVITPVSGRRRSAPGKVTVGPASYNGYSTYPEPSRSKKFRSKAHAALSYSQKMGRDRKHKPCSH